MKRFALPTAFAAILSAATLSVVSPAIAATPKIDPVSSGNVSGGPIPVSVGSRPAGPRIRAGFVGITTEFWDMFKEAGTTTTAPDVPFEHVLENLAPDGGLDVRIGGDTTDWTWWPVPGMAQPPWARWTLTPAWMAVAQKLLEDVKAHLIIGINMEADNPLVAATEVNAIKAGIGPTVPTTFEIGNEPELYTKWPFYITKSGKTVRGRPASYSFPQIDSDWSKLASALGDVRLAGVSYSSFRAFPDVERFLRVNPDVSLLTMHTYALTPRDCQKGGALQESELFDAGSLQNLGNAVATWSRLSIHAKVPLRIDEINAVTCGGVAGFSNSMGPSLWALNILPLYAQTGVTGVNFESRVKGAQDLIEPADTSSGWQVTVQPEYYGMLAFARLTPPGSRILGVTPLSTDGLLAWAVETPQHTEHVVVTNVAAYPQQVAIQAAGTKGPATTEVLKDASDTLTATTGVTLGGQTLSPQTGELTGTPVTTRVKKRGGAYDLDIAPASATILTVAR
ncbi:MAG TPA: hypothetical protein VHU61_13880 [Solirubrobacteraceae bacterium]|nr:hypothetical protein [Solirubrobacteraceae bacterium]